MSVRELGQAVVARVWVHLKPLGFKRRSAMFLRDGPQLGERYAIHGSPWNSGSEPWDFSVSVGLFFPDLAPFPTAKGFWKYCHAVGDAVHITSECPERFQVSAGDVDLVSSQVIEAILSASDALPNLAPAVRERARQGLISPLPVPETWI